MPSSINPPSRRQLLINGITAGGAAFLWGCCRIHRVAVPFCGSLVPTEAASTDASLTIDCHCHVFNGTDLQVAQFIKLNASLAFDQTLKELAGDLLQDLTWTFAPTGCDEYKELGELARCSNASFVGQRVDVHRDTAFHHAQSALKKTAVYRRYDTAEARRRRAAALQPTDTRTRYLDTLGSLLDAKDRANYQQRDHDLRHPADRKKSAISPQVQLGNLYVAGLFKFILQGFNYRFVSVLDYLKTYNPKGIGEGRNIDLMVANLVDYDWPLAEGCATKTSLRDQLDVMERINDLNQAIEEKDKQIADSRELLDRDRDIRNLIGARNLYIAEIYDVGQSGDTQKPFGRVFYTKDKSLIFYGYDLDQQPGIKKAGAFQAWGGRGADRQHAVSLGLLYKDDANQKRWVLKSNDAKTISQIDAVFVTVEPEGGSTKPSGKPLLFTYLRLDPNHP